MANLYGIQGLRPPAAIEAPAGGAPRPAAGPGQSEFGNFFAEAIGKVEGQRQAAEDVAGRFLRGETEEVHQVVLATQRAELAFEAFLQVRNKVVQAYQEVMRMQM
jgi:flagellar hook-basal body complex protein FliE